MLLSSISFTFLGVTPACEYTKKQPKDLKQINNLMKINKMPYMTESLYAVNLYELQNKLVLKHVRHGIYDFKLGDVGEELGFKNLDDEFYFRAAHTHRKMSEGSLKTAKKRFV